MNKVYVRPVFVVAFVVHMLCLAAIIFVSAYEWVFVLLGWFPSARAINITAARYM